jgi:hypothetical protein
MTSFYKTADRLAWPRVIRFPDALNNFVVPSHPELRMVAVRILQAIHHAMNAGLLLDYCAHIKSSHCTPSGS